MIKNKLIPFFGKMRVSDIKPIDVVRWQNELMIHPRKGGKLYSLTCSRTLNNQISAIFNHVERYYDLQSNPCGKVAKMGSKKGKEIQFWTKEKCLKFSDAIMDKPLSFYIFEILYWTGIRVGELLALTSANFLFDTSELSITKSYQSLRGVDTITDPKTPKSIRRIAMPKFLADRMKEYLEEFRTDIDEHDRIFPVIKHYLGHKMDRGCKAAGVRRIRIRDLRHNHVSLFIEMGFSALAISDRLGHETYEMTLRYAHLFPGKQSDMAAALDQGRRL